MSALSRRLPARRDRAGDTGFTLVELLVVVVIIGILIAIAIPTYLNYQKGSHDRAAQSDIRSAVSAIQSCFGESQRFPDGIPSGYHLGPLTGGPITVCGTETYNLSDGTNVWLTISDARDSYKIDGSNTKGSGRVYCYNSAAGGSVASYPAGSNASAAPC